MENGDLVSQGRSLPCALWLLFHKGESALHLTGRLVPACQHHGGHSQLKLAAKPVLSLEDHYEDQEGTWGKLISVPLFLFCVLVHGCACFKDRESASVLWALL